jgi:hypothetical protein
VLAHASIDRALRESGSVEVRANPRARKLDPRRVRGWPAAGKGVRGAIADSDPLQVLERVPGDPDAAALAEPQSFELAPSDRPPNRGDVTVELRGGLLGLQKLTITRR